MPNLTRFFSRSGFILWVGAVIGAVAVLPYVDALKPLSEAARESGLSVQAILAISVVQSAVFLGLMTFSGLWAAKKLRMGAPWIEAKLHGHPMPYNFIANAAIAIVLGIACGLAIMILDQLVFMPLDPDGLGQIAQEHPAVWKGLLGSLYGGISEEVQMRLFLLSFVALGLRQLYRIGSRDDKRVMPTWVFWSANILVAVIFGLGHLPMMAELMPLSTLIIVRSIVLNGLVGVVAGVLFWRRGIEMAMMCHFSADIILHVLLPMNG